MPVVRLLEETFIAAKRFGAGCFEGSVDRCDAGDTAAFAPNLLLICQQFAERDKHNPIALLVQPLIGVTRDLDTKGATFFRLCPRLGKGRHRS